MRKIYRNIKYGILRCIEWFPIMWNDCHWDYVYIFIILRKKLQLTMKYIEHGHSAYPEHAVKRIQECVFLLNRIIKDDYYFVNKVFPSRSVLCRKYFLEVDKLREGDYDRLFYIMRKYIQGWWD